MWPFDPFWGWTSDDTVTAYPVSIRDRSGPRYAVEDASGVRYRVTDRSGPRYAVEG